MRKILFVSFLWGLVLSGVSFADEAAQNRAVCSLKITEDGSRMEPAAGPKTIVILDGQAAKTQKFLLQLWKRNRLLFKDAQMNEFGPDASYQEITFVCGEQKVIARSWHRLAEENPQAVVTSRGISSLDGRTREAVLSSDEKWYLDFRKAFDDIFDKAISFKEQ